MLSSTPSWPTSMFWWNIILLKNNSPSVWLTVFLFLGMGTGVSCLPSYLGSLWINLDCPVLILRASVHVLGGTVWKVPRPLQQILQIVLGVGEVARVIYDAVCAAFHPVLTQPSSAIRWLCSLAQRSGYQFQTTVPFALLRSAEH